MSEPRAKTAEEVRTEFLRTLRALVRYWNEVPHQTPEGRLDGLAFSFLNILDGTNMALPAMDLVVRPHEDDQVYCAVNGDNWYEDGQIINDCSLHELWHVR